MEENTNTVMEEEKTASAAENMNEEIRGEDAPAVPDYAAMARADILALRAEFPETLCFSSLSELENPTRYAELREMGLSPKEAYLATTKRSASPIDNRSHLQSAVPRAVVGSGDGISKEELSAARDLFSGLSDHEIRKLYRKVTE